MNEIIIILVLIVTLLVCLVLTIVKLLQYIGIFSTPKISTGKPQFGEMYVAYKYHEDFYKNISFHFAEVNAICQNLSTIGIFYDDPKKIDKEKRRFVIGVILSESNNTDYTVEKKSIKELEDKGFNFVTLPEISYSINSTFPYIITASGTIGARKIYSAMEEYIDRYQLSAHPYIEVYTQTQIVYMVPLSMQNEFYPEEAKHILEKRNKLKNKRTKN